MNWFMSAMTVLICLYAGLSDAEPLVKAVLLVGLLGFLLGVGLTRDGVLADALLIVVLLTTVLVLQASTWAWFAIGVFAAALAVRLVLRVSGGSIAGIGAVGRR